MEIISLRSIVGVFFDILYFLIIIRILLSFFPVSPYGNQFLADLVRFIRQFTDPILTPFRKVIPPVSMGSGASLDLSPIVAIFVLRLLRSFLMNIL